MGNKHSRTFKTHRKKNNTTLKNRKNMTGGGTWKQVFCLPFYTKLFRREKRKSSSHALTLFWAPSLTSYL